MKTSIELTQFDGSILKLTEKPKNIVSLVPSITENLIQFGKIPSARTSFCIEPRKIVPNIPAIGGTKTPRVAKIISMKPDLVIANQEENIKAHVEEIQAAGIPVWITFPQTVFELPKLMRELSSLCDDSAQADMWIAKTESVLKQKFQWKVKPRIATLIWKEPWMAVGKDTYTSNLIEFCGGENPIPGRYPEIAVERFKDWKIDILLLPSEPYEFESVDVEFWKPIVPQVIPICGEDILWSGPRFIDAAASLVEICKSFEKNQLK